jgi:hypothetical protein
VDLDETLYDVVEDDLDSALLSLVASIITKWRTFKLLGWTHLLKRLVDLDEILYGGEAIEDDFYSVVHNPVVPNISKWQTFKLLRYVQLLKRLVDLLKCCMEVMPLRMSSKPIF